MIFSFGDFSREVDNMDVRTVKLYEEKLEEFYRTVAGIDMKSSASGIYGAIVGAGESLMEGFFGIGSAREMFKESQSVRKVMTAVCALNSFMNDVGGVIEDMKRLGA